MCREIDPNDSASLCDVNMWWRMIERVDPDLEPILANNRRHKMIPNALGYCKVLGSRAILNPKSRQPSLPLGSQEKTHRHHRDSHLGCQEVKKSTTRCGWELVDLQRLVPSSREGFTDRRGSGAVVGAPGGRTSSVPA